MINRTDWEAAHRDLIAEGRRKLGELPNDDELLAFSRGELPEERASRIRELLCYYPEIARALAMPFLSPEEIRPGDPDFLSNEVLEQDWKEIQAHLPELAVAAPAPETPLKRFLRKFRWPDLGAFLAILRNPLLRWRLATAAALVLAAVLGFEWRTDVQKLTRELAEPRVNPERRLLLPDGERGAAGGEAPIVLETQAGSLLLVPTVADHPPYPEYLVRVVADAGNGEKETWSASGLRRDGNTFEIWVPRTFLASGNPYRFELYGVRAGTKDLLGTYTVQLSTDVH